MYHCVVESLANKPSNALALDTLLPTSTGWTTVGDVQVDDELLDENGLPVRVLGAPSIIRGRRCFSVAFRDGTTVAAGSEQLWPMDKFVGDRRRKVLVTTEEMARTGLRYERALTTGRTKCTRTDGVALWRTLSTPRVQGAAQQLPLDPYVLGYWLGDGDSDGPRVTTHSADLAHFLKYCEQVGLSTTGPQRTHGETYRVRFASGSRGGAHTNGDRAVGVNALRELGVLGNKHIPTRVMRLDAPSRMKVLQGLMDSDGTVDLKGKVELCFTSRCLAIDSAELIRSLGFYPRMRESDAVLRGRVMGTRYRINFTAYSDDPVFLLPRKSARLKSRPQTMPYSQVRTVIAIAEIDSVPLRRVTISGGSKLYLAGMGLVPTYSSHRSQDHL